MSDSQERNFDSISPSAKPLLLLKGYTNIPFARRAAELAIAPKEYVPDFASRDFRFWVRVLHFENRYWSIDQLMQGLNIKNVLELSSGFSFRGLEMIKQPGIHYIDTDLPDMISTKKEFLGAMPYTPGANSTLETLPLNALDEHEFEKIVDRFPPGPIVIVNEGLLMYLDMAEKKKLCAIIDKLLQQRGGYWITADIYIRKHLENFDLSFEEITKAFMEQHHIEENKFESFETAQVFFKEAGFAVDEEAVTDREKLSSLSHIREIITEEQRLLMGAITKRRATWRLKIL